MRVKQKPNYSLMIATDSYTGNFERELIGYTFGILDDVQMEINHSSEYRGAFQEEENMTEEDCYNFLEKYLFETYQEVDDWEQMTFNYINCLMKYGKKESLEGLKPFVMVNIKKLKVGTF